MRKTVDGYEIYHGSTRVYEILWVYHNAECSEAVPHMTPHEDVPEDVRIWRFEMNCKKECDRLNKLRMEELDNLVNKSK